MDIFFEQYNRDFYISAGTNLNYPSHFQSEVELMYIASGKMDVTEGGKCYTLSSGDIFIVFPNREHSYKSDHENKHIMLIFDPEWCGLSRDVFTNYIPDCPIIRSNDAPPLWSRILKEMVSEYRSNLDSRIEICRSYTLVIALQLLRFLLRGIEFPHTVLQSSKGYIQEDCAFQTFQTQGRCPHSYIHRSDCNSMR